MEMTRIESKLKWVWIAVVTCLLWFLISSNACSEDERIALLRLKPFFNDPYHYLKNWVEVKGSNCCQWERVECNSTTGHIISLALYYTRNTRLGDRLHLDVSLFLPFVELKALYLQDNNIAGFVEIHEGFAKLSSTLEILDLSQNYLNDSILSSLSQLSSLKYLDLSYNRFTGSSQTNGFKQLSRLSNLETLSLGGNSLNNSLLSQIDSLLTLKTLYLWNNNFEGTLHIQELNNLTNLKTLDLSVNKLDSLRSEHQGNKTQLRLTNLEELYLGGNLFRNDTFAFSPGLSSLKSLYMNENQLCGSIDIKGLNNLINLKKLDLSSNKIESLRSSRDNGRQFKLMHLDELYLGDNLFNNSVFTSLTGLSNSKYLDLSYNQLKGSIDMTDFSSFTNLEELDMSYNDLNKFLAHKGNKSLRKLEVLQLNGVIANGSLTTLQEIIESFSYVKTFYLKRNYFNRIEGTQELNVSSHVEQLFLDFSHLNTNILRRIGLLTSLKTLSLSYSGLTGTLPDQGWCDLRKLEELYIVENGLEGKLPSCLGNLTSLRVLDISSNQFTGNLTPLANLRSLRFLSLSQNHFQVPLLFLSLSNLTDLKILFSEENQLVLMEPVFYTSVPKFQLKIVSLAKCSTNQKLTEELTKFLYLQHDLRYVDLSYNNLNGTVPFWLLKNNTKLETLLLMGNSLTGPLLLPPLPYLNLLSVIDISNNNLQGQIPTNICSIFPHLEWLFFSNNAFEGNIPPCLGGMSYLLTLDLSSNQLSGKVPKELTMNSSLWTLRLSNNNLSGNIVPTILSNSLWELYLDGNNFVGEIPELDIQSIDISHSSLSDIDLSNNSLLGKIPRWIWNLPYLKRLALSNNHFEGTISMDLCNLDGLEFLDLAQNNLSGSTPSCFNPPLIRHVHLSRNKLNGSLKQGFFNSSSLVTLDLSENNLTGNIPEWIGTLSALSVLLLKANNLDGEIPVQLCKLYSLSIIDLSHNMFSGPIPSCLGNLTLRSEYDKSSINALYYISPLEKEVSKYIGMERTYYDASSDYPESYMEEWVEFSTKSGSYLYGGSILDYMSGIDFSCNNLTGHIPLELGNLSEIHSLNFSHNNLTGVIPLSFSNLKQIESMDLSYNNLAGEIPKQLVELNSLEVFSVAHNNLSGTTPEPKAQFGTFNESSYEGNPLLCGPPLHNICCKTDLPSKVSTASDEEGGGGLLDEYVFCVSFLVAYVVVLLVIFAVLYINPYWRQLWFLFVEDCIDSWRYSVVGNFVGLYIFKRCA